MSSVINITPQKIKATKENLSPQKKDIDIDTKLSLLMKSLTEFYNNLNILRKLKVLLIKTMLFHYGF